MPSRAEPLNNLGMVYEEARQIDRALEFYAMALEISPNDPVYVGNIVRAHLRSGRDLESIRGLLHQLLMHDTRPEWIGWAEDLLGVSQLPKDIGGVKTNMTDRSEPMHKEPAEDLPLPRQHPVE